MSVKRVRNGLGRTPKPLLLAIVVGTVVAIGLGVSSVRKFADPAAVTRTASKPMTFPEIFDRVAPAVVAVEVSAEENPLLRFFQQRDPRAEAQRQSAGSGFFMSADGLVVTNNHVIEGAREIAVSLHDGRTLPATVVGRDATIDLAVLKVSDPNDRNARFPYVDFKDSAEPRVGDWVLAVGNPFGLGGTATAGIVSAYGRDIESSGLVPYLQMDASINRGDFGGPSFDVYGRVVGVNTAIFSPSGGGSIGIGFAIPASVAAETVEALAEGRVIARGFIGATIQTLTLDQATALGLKGRRGALVAGVAEDGPADRAGLRAGDVVTSVGGEPVASSAELTRRVANAGPNRRIELEVLREGKARSVAVRTGTRPPPQQIGSIF